MVVLFANDGISDVSRAYREGADGFVSKVSETLPFNEPVPLIEYCTGCMPTYLRSACPDKTAGCLQVLDAAVGAQGV